MGKEQLVFEPQESMMRMVAKGAFATMEEAIVYFGPDAGEFIPRDQVNQAGWEMIAWMQVVIRAEGGAVVLK